MQETNSQQYSNDFDLAENYFARPLCVPNDPLENLPWVFDFGENPISLKGIEDYENLVDNHPPLPSSNFDFDQFEFEGEFPDSSSMADIDSYNSPTYNEKLSIGDLNETGAVEVEMCTSLSVLTELAETRSSSEVEMSTTLPKPMKLAAETGSGKVQISTTLSEHTDFTEITSSKVKLCTTLPISLRSTITKPDTEARTLHVSADSVETKSNISAKFLSHETENEEIMGINIPMDESKAQTRVIDEGKRRRKRKKETRARDSCDNLVVGELDDMPKRRCTHCQTERTPQWREGPLGKGTLCNACGVRFKSGRLVPEYRPAGSPTFDSIEHSNFHREVLKIKWSKEKYKGHVGSPTFDVTKHSHFHRKVVKKIKRSKEKYKGATKKRPGKKNNGWLKYFSTKVSSPSLLNEENLYWKSSSTNSMKHSS